MWYGLLYAKFVGNFSFLESMVTGNIYLEKLEKFAFPFLQDEIIIFQKNMEYRLLTAELFRTQRQVSRVS
jgi:hypothetical protein